MDLSKSRSRHGRRRNPSVQYPHGQDCHSKALEYIISATTHALNGDHDKAEYDLRDAITWADMEAEKGRKSGKHDQSKTYMESINGHINRIRKYKGTMKSEGCDEDHSKLKKDGCKSCGYMVKSELQKGFLPPTQMPPPPSHMVSRGAMRVGHPKRDARYNYKTVTDLHPHDQKLAQEKWGKGTGSYEYPVDRATGRLVHASRVATTKTPQAHGKAMKELASQHRPGQSVRIQGHNTHEGRLGIVRGAHPEFPGKIAVQVGTSEHHKIYVDPHQVRLAKPSGRVEKALVTVYNIRKAFMK